MVTHWKTRPAMTIALPTSGELPLSAVDDAAPTPAACRTMEMKLRGHDFGFRREATGPIGSTIRERQNRCLLRRPAEQESDLLLVSLVRLQSLTEPFTRNLSFKNNFSEEFKAPLWMHLNSVSVEIQNY